MVRNFSDTLYIYYSYVDVSKKLNFLEVQKETYRQSKHVPFQHFGIPGTLNELIFYF